MIFVATPIFDRIDLAIRALHVLSSLSTCNLGLPKPRHDHAVVMARFARDCMCKLQRTEIIVIITVCNFHFTDCIDLLRGLKLL